MKQFIVLIAAISLLLSGCGGYSISEDELNQALAKKLAKPISNTLKVSQGEEVIALTMQVSAGDLALSSDQGGLLRLTLETQLTGTLSLFSRDFALTSQITPVLETGIRLDQDKLYLVGPKIVRLKVEGAGFQDQMLMSVLPSIQGDIEIAIKAYFNENALYQLDHSLLEKWVAKFASEISIKQANLELRVL